MARLGGSRLLAWYRSVPVFIVLVLAVLSAVYAYAPSALVGFLYPLSYQQEIADSSARHNVDPYLVAAVIEVESGWDTEARSAMGAQGLMQLMPDTARDMVDKGLVDGEKYSLDDLTDPAVNIEFGTAYLGYLLDYFDGNRDRAVAAYNGGMGMVEKWVVDGGVLHNAITYPETQAYVVRVSNAHMRYQDLYGSVFQVS